MPDKIRIAVIGLGLFGASAGMALRRHADRVFVVGHDRNADAANAARKMGAVEKLEGNLTAAVSGADRVIIAVPADEVRVVLEVIADSLKPGCVILDMTEIKAPVIAWAGELLPDNVHFVGGHPLVIADGGTQNASADLFHGHLFALTPDARADEQAVRLATDLVNSLDAQPFFMEAYEHDGLVALTEQAPALLAAALMNVAARGDNWRDARKAAAGQFYSGSLIVPPTGAAAATACIAGREPLLHWLDALLAELEALRAQVADGDTAALAAEFDRALDERAVWLGAYASGRWDMEIEMDVPTSGGMFRQMLGFGRPRSAPPPKR